MARTLLSLLAVSSRSRATKAGSSFGSLAIAASEPVRGDADALTRAVVNLLDNALKYSERPHAIEVEVRRGEGFAELAVLDRGRGVPDAERERIVEPFRRVGS